MPKDALGHGSNKRGTSLHKPLADHPYHGKTNDELHYIIKDASEAGRNAEGMGKTEHKYHDQVNDAHTVLGYRKRLSDGEAAGKLSSGSSKSEAPPIHDAHEYQRGLDRDIAAFKEKYGGPKDHKAEQRRFNSGRREINRLKKQGK